MTDDAALLQSYAEGHSEEAFAELVRRRVGLVYTAALRRMGGDTHLAEDIVQQVFTRLARDAGRLSKHPALGAWLYASTRNAALNLMIAERRRHAREQEAARLRDLMRVPVTEANWDHLRPVLDGAMDHLGALDRTAVILRFFEKRSMGEIGKTLQITEDAARVRVGRALNKLRQQLIKRGITSSVIALADMLENQAMAGTPANLAGSVASAALAGVAGGAGVGASIFLSMITTKATGSVFGALAVLAAATTYYVEEQDRQIGSLRQELGVLEADHFRLMAQSRPNVAEQSEERARLAALTAGLTARGSRTDTSDRFATALKPGLTPVSSLTNAGQKTPSNTLQTYIWAVYHGDPTTLARLIAFGPGAREIVAQALANLPPASQEEFPTPESLMAVMVANRANFDNAAGYQITNDNTKGDNSVMEFQVQDANGQTRLRKIPLENVNGDWMIVTNTDTAQRLVNLLTGTSNPQSAQAQ